MEFNNFLNKSSQQKSKSTRKYTFIKRKMNNKNKYSPNLKLISTMSVIDACDYQCSSKCLNKISKTEILNIRKEYLPLNQENKNKWIQNYLSNNKQFSYGSTTIRWHINGHDCCFHCWSLATTISIYKMKNCQRTIHGSSQISKMKPYILTALSWMKVTFESMCEKMPTKEKYHLPCYLQWNDILSDLNFYLNKNGYQQISPSYFTRLRKKYFPKIKCPKYTRQGKCNICLDLKEKRMNSKDTNERKKLHKEFVEHNQNQMNERYNYNCRKIKAQNEPNEYLSLIIDGMNAAHFPIKLPLRKNTSRIDRIKLNIHGLIDHGNNIKKFYGSLDHWKHGADFVASIIWNYLNELKEKKINEKWPHTLFLQVDNCWKENKNRTIFSFLSLLITYGWFKEIYLYSLPPGHIHEDIDQLFSNWNIHYWKKGLQSSLEIFEFLK
jgi:hypothetical protein